MQQLKRAILSIGVPHFLSLAEWDQEDFIREVQRRRREFRPKKGNGEKLDFSPPQLTPSQRKVVEGMEIGREYDKGDLDCSISTLRALVGKGVVEGREDEAKWIRLETEFL